MKSIFLTGYSIVLYVPILVILAITPYITRKTHSFGVSIPEEVYISENVSQKAFLKNILTLLILWYILFKRLLGGKCNVEFRYSKI
jgi:hypothetical protein